MIIYIIKNNYHVDQNVSICCSEHSLLEISLYQKQNYHQKVIYLMLGKSEQADLARY